jgi:4-amino-4-deoxy-L-arabinose transferase-like glycosyltransferase
MRRNASRVPTFWWLLLAITLAGFVLRVAYVWFLRRQLIPIYGDAYWYSEGARIFARGDGILDPYALMGFRLRPSAAHPVLYLVWLSIADVVLHYGTQFTDLIWTCVLGSLTVMMSGLAGREVAGARVGLVAAALCALYPNTWVYDGELLSESIALFTVALIVFLAFRFRNRPSVARAAWLGFACGLGALARSELVLAVVLVLVPTVLLARAVSGRRRVGWLVAGGATFVLALSPWVVYNQGRFEHRVILTSEFGNTLAAANCDATYYGFQIGYKNYDCAHRAFEAAGITPDMDETVADELARHETMKYIRAHEKRLPVVVAARWARLVGVYRPEFGIDEDVFFFNRKPWVSKASGYSYDLMLALGIAGAIVLARRRGGVLIFLGLAAIPVASVAITFAQSRYRAVWEIPLIMLGAITIDALWRQLRPGEQTDAADASREPEEPVALTEATAVLPSAPR